jgi:hypothetical protein
MVKRLLIVLGTISLACAFAGCDDSSGLAEWISHVHISGSLQPKVEQIADEIHLSGASEGTIARDAKQGNGSVGAAITDLASEFPDFNDARPTVCAVVEFEVDNKRFPNPNSSKDMDEVVRDQVLADTTPSRISAVESELASLADGPGGYATGLMGLACTAGDVFR